MKSWLIDTGLHVLATKRPLTMTIEPQRPNHSFLADCDRIYREWHERAKARDMDGLLALYAQDAVLETPLVQAIYRDRRDGILRGHGEIGPFFAEATRRPLNELVRWYRSGRWLTDGVRLLAWEYPRATPDGDQVDVVELMEVAAGLIQSHRVYGGWLGTALLTGSRDLI
jgi:steroid Delta-isomerase